MKILLVHPGSNSSTLDVYNGLVPELRALGHECIEYRLDSRLDMAELWFKYIYRKLHRPGEERPNTADVLYRAGVEMIERALFFEVDGILLISGMFVVRKVLEMARRAGLRVGMLCTESPYEQDQEAHWVSQVDVAWTTERTSVEYLRRKSGNARVYYLPHAYDPRVHRRGPPIAGVPVWDVVFVGSAFDERIELLGGVDWTGINFGLYGQWKRLGSRNPLRQHVRGDIINNTYAASLYRNAKIGLNLYRQSMGWNKGAPRIVNAESLNPRALELAACGVFQVSDDRPEVREVFGEAVKTFSNAEGLEQWIRHALAHPDWRQTCAAEARMAIDRPEFTFAARAAQVSAQLEDAWATTSLLAKGA